MLNMDTLKYLFLWNISTTSLFLILKHFFVVVCSWRGKKRKKLAPHPGPLKSPYLATSLHYVLLELNSGWLLKKPLNIIIVKYSNKLFFEISRDIFRTSDLEFYYLQNLDFLPFRDQGAHKFLSLAFFSAFPILLYSSYIELLSLTQGDMAKHEKLYHS